MAFIGIFLLSMAFLWLIIVIVALIFALIFVPSLVLAIVNLVKGIRHHWPRHNIVLLSVFGSIAVTMIVLVFGLMVYAALRGDSSASEATSEYIRLLSIA